MTEELAAGARVLVQFRDHHWPAVVVHKMTTPCDCGGVRYHCRLAETGEDCSVCASCIGRLN